MTSLAQLFMVVEAYCVAAGIAEATLSTRVFGDGKRMASLRDGSDVGARRLEKAMLWLSQNWPDGAQWPDGVPRPAAHIPEAAE